MFLADWCSCMASVSPTSSVGCGSPAVDAFFQDTSLSWTYLWTCCSVTTSCSSTAFSHSTQSYSASTLSSQSTCRAYQRSSSGGSSLPFSKSDNHTFWDLPRFIALSVSWSTAEPPPPRGRYARAQQRFPIHAQEHSDIRRSASEPVLVVECPSSLVMLTVWDTLAV